LVLIDRRNKRSSYFEIDICSNDYKVSIAFCMIVYRRRSREKL